MVTVANPLDHFDSVLNLAIELTYSYVVGESYPPTLNELTEFFPPHFFQELSLHVVVTEQYFLLGVEDRDELIDNVADGAYDQFLPDDHALRFYLNQLNMNYLELRGDKYALKNDSIVEVW
jgi:hypothetical protein